MKTTLRKNRLGGAPNALRQWMVAATAQEKAKLAVLAKTSRGMLYQLAGGYRTDGRLRLDPELARRIETATVKLHREGLPLLQREQMAPACAKCEFAKACRG